MGFQCDAWKISPRRMKQLVLGLGGQILSVRKRFSKEENHFTFKMGESVFFVHEPFGDSSVYMVTTDNEDNNCASDIDKVMAEFRTYRVTIIDVIGGVLQLS